MDTLNAAFTYSRRAAACAFAVLLSACGGGGGPAPDAGIAATAAVPAPAAADVATQPVAASASPVVVPSPPDMSIEPPPGTVVTAAAAPDVSPSVASTVTTVDTGGAPAPATAVTLGAETTVELPDGAVACQPSTCPAFAVNGSVTNTYGADDPTAAHAYMLPASGPVPGAYPDLGNLPTMVIPPQPIVVGEAPQ